MAETESAGRNFYHGDDRDGISRQQSSSVWEIEEESELFEINHGGGGVAAAASPMASIKEEISLTDAGSMFSVDVNGRGGGGGEESCLYVGVGKGESSVEAVAWAVAAAAAAAESSSATAAVVVYLIHVFPQVHHIPSPLGKLPKSQVSREQVEKYMAQERGKRRELLQKFINTCSASKVKVETMLIESDLVAKAILDLIPILNIRKLVLGTSKSNVKKLLKHSRKLGTTNGGSNNNNMIAAQVLHNSPDWCEISVISGGKRVVNTTTLDDHGGGGSSSRSSSSPSRLDSSGEIVKAAALEEQLQLGSRRSDQNGGESFACMCFRSPKVTM